MSNARQALQITGMIVGSFFGPVGAAIGGMIGGELGGFIDGPPEGPRLEDTSAPAVEYGAQCPWVEGRVWCEIQPLWWSGLRESSATVGGKGGDSGVEQFNYHCDMLARLANGDNVIAWTRIEIDGEIVATQLADSSGESIAATAETDRYSAVELLTGGPTQTPWSVYEAAVGASNAVAYLGQCTIGFQNLWMRNGRSPSRIRVEVITNGTQGDGTTYWLLNFNGSEGSTDATDTSGQGNDATVSGMVQDGDAAVFGSTGMVADGSGVTGLSASGISVDWDPQTEGHTMEGRMTIASNPNTTQVTIGQISAAGQGIRLYVDDDLSPDLNRLVLTVFGESSTTSDYAGPGEYCLPLGAPFHWAVDWDPETNTATAYINGAVALQHTVAGAVPADLGVSAVETAYSFPATAGIVSVDGVRFDAGLRRYTAAFTPPDSEPEPEPGPWTPAPEDLQDVLERMALRCAPLTASNIEFSAAAGKDVHGYKYVGSAAQSMQPLLTQHYLDLFCDDKLRLVERGGAVEQTIAFRWSGAGGSDPFAGLVRDNDTEVRKRTSITYINRYSDGESDTVNGERVAAGVKTETLNLPIYMSRSEAQGVADTATWDKRVATHTATIRLGARHGLRLQPGSVVAITDHKGNTYRVLVRRAVLNAWVWECEVRLDDPNILSAIGIATDGDTRVIEVAPPAASDLVLLDTALFIDSDDGVGLYAAIGSSSDEWRGAGLRMSSDGVTYTAVGSVTRPAVLGTCSTALANWTGGWMWDETNTVTVTLLNASDTLSSSTRAAMYADRTINAAAIVHDDGTVELIRFRIATLDSAGVYTLSGLLRGQRGTEFAIAGHGIGDRFVLIANNGILRVPHDASAIGSTYYFQAVSAGASSGTTVSAVLAAESQRPLSPVNLRNDGTNVTWARRSRLSAPPYGLPPLGEESESYLVRWLDGSDVEIDSETTTSRTVALNMSAAKAAIAQVSATVGAGHETELTL